MLKDFFKFFREVGLPEIHAWCVTCKRACKVTSKVTSEVTSKVTCELLLRGLALHPGTLQGHKK